MEKHKQHMSIAIAMAKRGETEQGIPIGAVLVRDEQVIGRGRNRRMQQRNPILHAEIDCLQNAGRIDDYSDTVLYTTLMPCHMCAGAIVQFKIPVVVVGESRTFKGAKKFLKKNGVKVIDLDDNFCKTMMDLFISVNKRIWNEDIGTPLTKKEKSFSKIVTEVMNEYGKPNWRNT
ncbi:MAG TPA: nucleoside deaminase [bacterium]|nr:nucleoside deaminase [bacterium]